MLIFASETNNNNPLINTKMKTNNNTEKQEWIKKETEKIMAQGLSAETTRRMLEMINDFANWSF